jgi:tryptophan 2,3-dioxygenase
MGRELLDHDEGLLTRIRKIVTDPAVTYASYLKMDELLRLQEPRSQGPEHDELLFIVIHQVYELWFKQLLHVKMVERTIGARRGTGGSAGAAYLQQTIGRPLFPDLWEIRTQL